MPAMETAFSQAERVTLAGSMMPRATMSVYSSADTSNPTLVLLRERKSTNVGFDVSAEEYTDMVARGIIDPAKVTRSACENAVSIAGMILTTEALITDVPEKEHH